MTLVDYLHSIQLIPDTLIYATNYLHFVQVIYTIDSNIDVIEEITCIFCR